MKFRSVFSGVLSTLIFSSVSCTSAAVKDEPSASKRYVTYEEFNAKGDGKTDDMNALVSAHAFANEHGLPVKAKDGATYYIGGQNKKAIIQTDTDFGNAEFIIDDRQLENIKSPIFEIRSTQKPIDIKNLTSLKRFQRKLDIDLPSPCLLKVKDSNVKRYIRKGNNRNNGKDQTDIFIVDEKGEVDMTAPIIWDFKTITSAEAFPIDQTRLTIKGGRFKTIANQAESKYNYHHRGFIIRRSNVLIENLEHVITGEGNQGAPYIGFLNFRDACRVVIKDCRLSGHKTYRTIGRAGNPVSMGSYDINLNSTIDATFINCSQINDFMDRRLWGIMASNHSKNLRYEGCTLSRFDAHMGVSNATIINSSLRMITVVGEGTLLLDGVKKYGRSLVDFRRDYGSTWMGDVVVRNSTLIDTSSSGTPNLFVGNNQGDHDFGYPCHMPEDIYIDGLIIEDARKSKDYKGPFLFSDWNRKLKDPTYVEKYPILRTQKVTLKNVSTKSGKRLRVSESMKMFGELQISGL